MLNFLLVVLWAFALPYPRFRPMASCLATVWTCIIIVCKMLYQLKVVNPHEYTSNCTEVRTTVEGQMQRAWVGVHPRGQHAVSAAPLPALPQQYEPAEDRDPPVLAVPRACRPRQLVWSAEGLPQPGLHSGECSRQVGQVGALQGG